MLNNAEMACIFLASLNLARLSEGLEFIETFKGNKYDLLKNLMHMGENALKYGKNTKLITDTFTPLKTLSERDILITTQSKVVLKIDSISQQPKALSGRDSGKTVLKTDRGIVKQPKALSERDMRTDIQQKTLSEINSLKTKAYYSDQEVITDAKMLLESIMNLYEA